MQTIACKYSCDLCGLDGVAVDVPVRGEEDVVTWLERIAMVAVARDHVTRSPRCRAQSLSKLMIPIDGRDQVGGAVRN